MNFVQVEQINSFLYISKLAIAYNYNSEACMNQFVLQQGSFRELRLFPHIIELGTKKNPSIQLNSFPQQLQMYQDLLY